MRYLALVTDYDGTLATHGKVSDATATAIQRLRNSGRHAILATGRRPEDVRTVCPYIDAFSQVVAENGALVFDPKQREVHSLAEPLPASSSECYDGLNITPLEVGTVIVSTLMANQAKILALIQASGLELKIVFNRDALMILPTGVNQASGTRYALHKLGLSPHEIVAVGDSENDHSILQIANVLSQWRMR